MSLLQYGTRPFIRSRMITCAFHCAQLSYTTQHCIDLIIFPLNLQTSDVYWMGSRFAIGT